MATSPSSSRPTRRIAPEGGAHARGRAAEVAAQHFLQAAGFELVAANYHCRQGEIDLVMQRGDLLLFAEVRLRRRSDFGGAAASVTASKQQKIIATAEAFLQHRPEFSRCQCRFDVLALTAADTQTDDWQMEWMQAAFTT
jgi:putative endonuclease